MKKGRHNSECVKRYKSDGLRSIPWAYMYSSEGLHFIWTCATVVSILFTDGTSFSTFGWQWKTVTVGGGICVGDGRAGVPGALEQGFGTSGKGQVMSSPSAQNCQM